MAEQPSPPPPTGGSPIGGSSAPGEPPEGAEPSARPGLERASPTWASASWAAVIIATVALVVLCVFLAQNTQRATVHFLGFAANAPLAVLLLFAAALGAVMVAAAGLARIVELRNGRRRPPGRRPRRIAREPRGFGGAGGGKGLDHG